MAVATASASFTRVIGPRDFFQSMAAIVLDQDLYPGHWKPGGAAFNHKENLSDLMSSPEHAE